MCEPKRGKEHPLLTKIGGLNFAHVNKISVCSPLPSPLYASL